MATDEVGIYNLALSIVGAKSSVSDVSEKSRERELCTLWYQPTIEQILRAAPWQCATAWRRLALAKERDNTEAWVTNDPDPGWRYAYSTPPDMIRPRFISDYSRFSLSVLNGSHAIMTNREDAVLCYTARQLQVGMWDAQLKMAVVHTLAAYVAMPLLGKPARAQNALETATRLVMEARQSNANEEEESHEALPVWFQARGYGYTPTTRYIYPNGPMLKGTDVGVE